MEPRAASLLVLLEVVYSITDPPIKALRRVIPPLRLGSVALDLSFLIVMITAYVLLRVNRDDLLRPDRRARGGCHSCPRAGAIVRPTVTCDDQ